MVLGRCDLRHPKPMTPDAERVKAYFLNHPSPERRKNGLLSMEIEAGALAEELGMSTDDLIRAMTILWNNFFFVDTRFHEDKANRLWYTLFWQDSSSI